MNPFLEIHRRSGINLFPLEERPVAIGKSSKSDVCITDDKTVSRLHAVIEPIGTNWYISDLGSRNGTFVNGERIWSQKALYPGDEIRVGATVITLRADREEADAITLVADMPRVTSREHDVLVALCKPLMSGSAFTQPATSRQIAEDLVVSVAAVKQHLARLYDKFGIYDESSSESRRVRLANAALACGAVQLTDLRDRE